MKVVSFRESLDVFAELNPMERMGVVMTVCLRIQSSSPHLWLLTVNPTVCSGRETVKPPLKTEPVKILIIYTEHLDRWLAKPRT